jgi:hypothetical protein
MQVLAGRPLLTLTLLERSATSVSVLQHRHIEDRHTSATSYDTLIKTLTRTATQQQHFATCLPLRK